MKKITLAACMFAVVGAFAQANLGAYNPMKDEVLSKLNLHTIPSPKHAVKAAATTPTTSVKGHWLNWGNQVINYDKANNKTDSSAYYISPIFYDSTATMISGGNPIQVSGKSPATNNYGGFLKVGGTVDPKSPKWDPAYKGTPLFGKNQDFYLDTIVIYGIYNLSTADTAHHDTLLIEVAWGDTANNNVWAKYTNGSHVRRICPAILPSGADGQVSTLAAAKNDTMHYLRIPYILSNGDTSGGIQYGIDAIGVALPQIGLPGDNGNMGGIHIPHNNIYTIMYTFIPGKNSNYSAGMDVYNWDGTSPGGAQQPTASSDGFMAAFFSSNAKTAANAAFYTDMAGYYNWAMYVDGAVQYTGGTRALLDPYSAYNISSHISYDTLNPASSVKNVAAANFAVNQNVPNPSTGLTQINYEIPTASTVALDVFNIAGQHVMSMEQGNQYAGNHTITLNTAELQSGVYFYTLTAGQNRVTKRMTVIKN